LETKEKLRIVIFLVIENSAGFLIRKGAKSNATTEALQQAQVQNGVQLSFLSCWWSWFWVNSVLVFLELHLLCISLQGTALSTNI
jgi:hypothetical protein